MFRNIDKSKMNQLMEENEDVKELISQLLANHHTTVSMISHEIRNPLTLISSSLQIIEAQHPEVKEFSNWDQTMDNVDFMCSLLNDLSTFNNGHVLHYSVFDLEQMLQNIAISFAISLDADHSNIQFTSHIPSGIGSFTGDKIKLEEVLLNLLRNARDAVSDDGTIFLSAERNDHSIMIKCSDNGCGITEDQIPNIFIPFITYKENGTGLGLSLSRRIIEKHSGTLTVDSSPESGTTFVITLPV